MIELIRMGAADIIDIELMKTGGISNALHIAGMYQVECMIGCMLETSTSVAAAVHVAVAKSNVQPLLYQSALQHLLDLIFVLSSEEGGGRLARLNVNLARRQHILEP